MPADTPVTIPDALPTVALALLLLQVPPAVPFASVVAAPTQTVVEPVIAGSAASTVTVVIAWQEAGLVVV